MPANYWEVELTLLVILCTSNVQLVHSFSNRGGRIGEDLRCVEPFETNVLIRCYRALMNMDSVYLIKNKAGWVVSKCHFSYPYAVKQPREFAFVVEEPGMYEISTEYSHGIFHQKIVIEVKPLAPNQECTFNSRMSGAETIFSIENCRNGEATWEVYREFPFLLNRKKCVNPDFMGKVDVAGIMALRHFRPADVFHVGKYFSIDLKKLPIGFLEVRAHVRVNRAFFKTYSALEFVLPVTEPVFVTDISPYSDNLPWSSMRSFIMSTDIIVVPLSDKSGFVGRLDHLLRYTWSCDGPSIVCSEVDRIVATNKGRQVKEISVSGRILRKCINKAFTIKLKLEVVGPWKLYLNVIKRVHILDGSWPVIELLCIRNCQKNRLFSSVSQRLAMYCHRCEKSRYHVKISWPQCYVHDGRCRHYMYYDNWYNPDSPTNTFISIVKKGDEYHTFSFSYKFDPFPEAGSMSPKVLFKASEMMSRFILRPTIDVNLTGHDFEMVEVSLIWPSELQGQKQLPLFSSFQSVFPVPMNLEDDISSYIFDFPVVQVRQCARGHCYDEQTSIEFPKSLQDRLRKNQFIMSINTVLGHRMNDTESIAPIWMVLYVFHLKYEFMWKRIGMSKHRITVKKMSLVKDKITYSQTEVALLTVSAAISLFNETYKNDVVKDQLMIVETAMNSISTCTTDMPQATIKKHCLVAKTLTELLNWMNPQFEGASGSNKVNQFTSIFLRILRKLAVHTLQTFDHRMQNCIDAGWQLMWQKFVLVDADKDGYYRPEVFRLPQRMSDLLEVRFQRRALYWKVRSQPKMKDYMVHLTIYHVTKPIHPKPWITSGMKYQDAGTTVIDMFQESSGASIMRTQSSGALQILFSRGDPMESDRDNEESSSAGLKSDYFVKEGELVATCHWIVISTTTEVLRTLTIDFHSNKKGTTFSVMFMRAKNSEAFVGFHDLAETYFTEKQSVHILDKVTKSFNYDNPEAKHVFRLSVSHVKGLEAMEDSMQTFYISLTLSQTRCSYLEEMTQEWDTDVCKIIRKTDTTILCECKRSSGVFSADIIRINEQLSMVKVKQYLKLEALMTINEEIINPQLVVVIALWIIYITMMSISMYIDKENEGMFQTRIAESHFNPEDKFQYMICIKTSALPHAGTTSRAWITIIGKLRATADILLDNKRGFERASECWFLASTAFFLGDIVGVFIRLDNVVVDDNWRINQIEVYDCQRDRLFRFPNYNWLSQYTTTQLCASDLGKKNSLAVRIFSKFGEMLRDYHQLLCFFLSVPGCRRMMFQVSRLQCSILWCMVCTMLFVTGVPSHRFKESRVQVALQDVFITIPVIMLLNVLYIRTRMLLVPNYRWGLAKPRFAVPPARVVDRLHHHTRANSKRSRLRTKIIEAAKKMEEKQKAKGKFKARAHVIRTLTSSLKSSINQRGKLKSVAMNSPETKQEAKKSRASGVFWPFGKHETRKDSAKGEEVQKLPRGSLIKGRKSQLPDQNNSNNELEDHRGDQNNHSNCEHGGQKGGQTNTNEPGGKKGGKKNSNNKPGRHGGCQNNNSYGDRWKEEGRRISVHAKPSRSVAASTSNKTIPPKHSLYASMMDILGLRAIPRSPIISSVDEAVTGPPGGGKLNAADASGQNLRAIRPQLTGMWIVDRVFRIALSANYKAEKSNGTPKLNDVFNNREENVPFVDSPIRSLLQDPHWIDDPIMARDPCFGGCIYSYTTSRLGRGVTLGTTHRYKFNEESGDRDQDRKQLQRKSFQNLIGKNIMITLITLNIILCTSFISQTSFYLRNDKMMFTSASALFVFASIVLIMEPLVLFLMTVFLVLQESSSTFRQAARKRFKDATIVLRRWYDIQEKDLSYRFRYSPSSMYSNIGSVRHSTFMNRLERKKKDRVEKETERTFKGNLSLPVFLLCVIVIMNVHGNIQSSFRQKDMIYKSLDFNDDVEHKAPDTNEMWQFLNEKYLRFFHALDNPLSVKKTRIFSKMRQIRVKPVHRNCSAPRIPIFRVPELRCHVMLDEHTVDTQNYSRDWQFVYTDPNAAVASREKLFLYTPAKVESVLEYVGTVYPLGGYTYILSASYGDNSETLRKMEYSNWIDKNTRALIIETSVYDFNTGVATALVITYHFQVDGIRLSYENQSFAFSFRTTSIIILLIAFTVLATLTFIELSTQYSKAVSFGVFYYMKDKENIMTIISLTFYIFILIGFVFRFQLSYKKYSTLSRTIYGTDGELFLNMKDLGFMVFYLNGLSGFLAFTALMTILQSAKNIPKLYIMLMMIRNVFILSTFPAIVIIMMAMSSFLAFQTTSIEMSTFKNCVYSVMQFVLDPQGMNIGSPGISNTFTVLQWTAFFVIITNGFVVTLNEDYSVLVMETKKTGSKSILSSLTEMALASFGVINLEDTTSQRQTLEDEKNKKRQAAEDEMDKYMYCNMGNGW